MGGDCEMFLEKLDSEIIGEGADLIRLALYLYLGRMSVLHHHSQLTVSSPAHTSVVYIRTSHDHHSIIHDHQFAMHVYHLRSDPIIFHIMCPQTEKIDIIFHP